MLACLCIKYEPRLNINLGRQQFKREYAASQIHHITKAHKPILVVYIILSWTEQLMNKYLSVSLAFFRIRASFFIFTVSWFIDQSTCHLILRASASCRLHRITLISLHVNHNNRKRCNNFPVDTVVPNRLETSEIVFAGDSFHNKENTLCSCPSSECLQGVTVCVKVFRMTHLQKVSMQEM